jgi:hypothetical protein
MLTKKKEREISNEGAKIMLAENSNGYAGDERQ